MLGPWVLLSSRAEAGEQQLGFANGGDVCESLQQRPTPTPGLELSPDRRMGKLRSEEETRFRLGRDSVLGQVSAVLVLCAGLSRTLWSQQLPPVQRTGSEIRRVAGGAPSYALPRRS